MAFGYLPTIAGILRFARNGVETTHLNYRANVSSNHLQSYLELLLKNNLLGMTVDSSQGKIYKTTLKGMAFLRHYHNLKDHENDRIPSEIFRMFSR